MFYSVDEAERRRGKSPHELAMINLLLFNLLIGVALLAGSMAEPDSIIARWKWPAVALTLTLSIAVMLFTWLRAARAAGHESWFVAAHWRLSASRYRILLAAYVVSAAVISLAAFDGGGKAALEQRIADLPPALQEMERHKLASQHMGSAIWARIGVVPLLLTVMTLIMLESGALYQAGRGEVPDGLIKRYPPPPDMAGSEQPILPPGAPADT